MRIACPIAFLALSGVPPAHLFAGPPPSMTRHPESQRVPAGHGTSLRGGSSDPLAGFAWEKLSFPLPGQTTPKLEIRHALPSDAGTYQLVASNRAEVAGEPTTGESASAPARVDVVMRPAAPGTVDLEFNDAGLIDGPVRALAPGIDGRVLAVGSFTRAGTRGVVLLRADGSPDPAFSAQPGAGDGAIHAATAHDDGWIVGGSFQSFQGTGHAWLVRLLANGRVDESFVPPPIAGTVRALATQMIEGTPRVLVGIAKSPWLMRLHADGRLDEAFASRLAATGLNNTVYALAVQPDDGGVVIGGAFADRLGAPCLFNRLGRLQRDGHPDTAGFRGTGAAGGDVLAVAIDTLGRIVAGGRFISLNGQGRRFLARVGANGDLDQSFDVLPKGNEVTAVACFNDGSLVVGGDFAGIRDTKGFSRQQWRSVARLRPDGVPDISWTPASFDGDIACLAIGSDGRLFAGGGFSQPHESLVALRTRAFAETPRVLAAASRQELTLGMGGTLQVAALADPDAAYIWHKVGHSEPLATTRTGELMVPLATVSDSGTYEVQIVSAHGTINVTPIDLRVRPRPAGARKHWRALTAAAALPVAVPDANETSVALWLPALTDVEEVKVTVALKHADTNDLEIQLVSPENQHVSLVEKWPTMRRGQDFDYTVFADQAEVRITEAPAPYTGTFRPSAAAPGLAALRGGHRAGPWSLMVADNGLDGITGELIFVAIDIFGPYPEIDAGILARCPCPDDRPELTFNPAAHRATLHHWLPDAAPTPGYDRAWSLSDWQSMTATTVDRLRRNDDQTAMVELLLPVEARTPHGFFRARW